MTREQSSSFTAAEIRRLEHQVKTLQSAVAALYVSHCLNSGHHAKSMCPICVDHHPSIREALEATNE